MAISLDRLVGFHQKAAQVRTDKMEVIAGNLANANTPGYKAQDINFKEAMKKANYGQNSSLVNTHEKHIERKSSLSQHIQFRNPDQPDTGDGNSVDVQQERNAFLDNGMRYQTSIMFLDGKLKGMKKALSSGGQ